MLELDHKLRHLPFFEFAASRDERSQEWREAAAGLVVLRLVDRWVEEGRPTLADDESGIAHVRDAVDDIPAGAVLGSLLHRVLDAMQEQDPDIHSIVTPLMAYGRALEYDAHWRLAADVYDTLLAHLHPVEDCDASIAAHLRLGSCYNSLNETEAAEAAFASASRIAGEAGDLVGVLRARIGEARIAIVRGNLPRAESLLEGTIQQASAPGLQEIRSLALHGRANVAHFRGQYEFAIELAYDALRQVQNGADRDRILGDIAVSFLELGIYTAARDAYLILSATAQEQYTRWAATLNLLEIATQTGFETLFHLHRRQLADEELPPYMATAYELGVGNGYQRFGDTGKARRHIERAIELARMHGFGKYLFDAEEALSRVETTAPPPKPAKAPSPGVAEVASAIRELRELAGVS